MPLIRVEDLAKHPALEQGDECFYLHEVPAQEVARLFLGEPASKLKDAPRPPTPDAVINQRLAEETRRVIATLTPEEEASLKARGIGRDVLDEVGADFEVTRQRIRQIEAKALGRLAMRVVAHELAQGLASESVFFGDLSRWTFVPIPSASASVDDVADEAEPRLDAFDLLKGLKALEPLKRLEPIARLLNELAGQVPDTLDVRASIRLTRPSFYEVDPEPPGVAGVLLFGAVLGDGARFRACKEALGAAFPGVRVVGIFVAKDRG